MDVEGDEVVLGGSSLSASANTSDAGKSSARKRPRKDDPEDSGEPFAQQRLVEIEGQKREREDAESEEERAKRSRLNIEQQLLFSALRRCSSRKKKDKRSWTYDVVELVSSPQVTARARPRGRWGCWSLNTTVVEPITGQTWDLLNPKDVKVAWNVFLQTQPNLLVAFASNVFFDCTRYRTPTLLSW